MATGGLFQIITNVGKQDELIFADTLLQNRIADSKAKRMAMIKAGNDNISPYPSLNEIEQTHILFTNIKCKPFVKMSMEYSRTPKSSVTLESQVEFDIPQFGDFFSDMVVNVVFDTVTASATGSAADASDVALCRYCDYPGERLFRKVQFTVNNAPLDEYYQEVYPFHRQFKVPADKLSGWNRSVGQSSANRAVAEYLSTTSSTAAPLGNQLEMRVLNGYQTYKTSQPRLSLNIPLLFWFCDIRQAVPSAAIPFGQRKITIDLESQANLIRAIVNPSATTALTSPTVTPLSIVTCDLYINNIFVDQTVQDIFINRIGFSLTRVHRRQLINLTKSNDQQQLTSLKWPTETIYVGFQPVANTTSNSTTTTRGSQVSVIDANMEDWHRFGVVTTTSSAAATLNGAGAGYIVKSEASHITTIGIQSYGIDLFREMPGSFFNSYIPFQYGGSNICTPTDPGLYMINFCAYPGSYQPSGHINISRSREFFIKYNSTYIASNAAVNMFVNAVSINFLFVSEGSAIMRFTT